MTPKEPLTGLFELDTAGTVLYYNPETDGEQSGGSGPLPDIIGRNLYTDIPAAQSFKMFRERLDDFRASGKQRQSFVFVFQFENRLLPMRVMLARISGAGEHGDNELILIRIMKGNDE